MLPLAQVRAAFDKYATIPAAKSVTIIADDDKHAAGDGAAAAVIRARDVCHALRALNLNPLPSSLTEALTSSGRSEKDETSVLDWEGFKRFYVAFYPTATDPQKVMAAFRILDVDGQGIVTAAHFRSFVPADVTLETDDVAVDVAPAAEGEGLPEEEGSTTVAPVEPDAHVHATAPFDAWWASVNVDGTLSAFEFLLAMAPNMGRAEATVHVGSYYPDNAQAMRHVDVAKMTAERLHIIQQETKRRRTIMRHALHDIEEDLKAEHDDVERIEHGGAGGGGGLRRPRVMAPRAGAAGGEWDDDALHPEILSLTEFEKGERPRAQERTIRREALLSGETDAREALLQEERKQRAELKPPAKPVAAAAAQPKKEEPKKEDKGGCCLVS